MSVDPYIGEIQIFPYNFAPRGWMFCDGQLLDIAQNQSLYSVIGTTYGGNGYTTMALPNLQGRIPMGLGQGPGLSPNRMGYAPGVQTVTLKSNEIPNHTHEIKAYQGAKADLVAPEDHLFGQAPKGSAPNTKKSDRHYHAYDPDNAALMNESMLSSGGNNQPHDNYQPGLGMYYFIAIEGDYPSRN